jgi:hypothetical protein
LLPGRPHKYKSDVRILSSLAVCCAATALAAPAAAALAPPAGVAAADVPDDGGGAIEISWTGGARPEVEKYVVLRTEGDDLTAATVVGEAASVDSSFTDGREGVAPPRDGVAYRYVVRAAGHDGTAADSGLSGPVRAEASWFHMGRAANLAFVLLFIAMFAVLVARGRRGKPLYIRPIDALEAMDDAVGRAAEMGRPVFYAPGLQSIAEPATLASVRLLGRVAELSARLHTRVKVPNFDPLTWPVAREVVRQSFIKAGRLDEFDADDVSYLTSRSFTYAAAVSGILVRERTATNFLIGHFFSESLILAETGVTTGALQIGGTDSVAQLPFFITTCDRTMIGEELFAAAALVGDDPVSRSTVKAHDWFKVVLMVVILGGVTVCLLFDTGLLEGLLSALGVDEPAAAAADAAAALRGGWL